MTLSIPSLMRALALLVLLATTAAITTPGTARAQVADRHHGMWLTTALGAGTSSISCDECKSGDLGAGVTATIGIGFALNPRLSLEVGTNGWLKKADGVMNRIGYSTALLRYYVSPRLYLGVGGGVAHHRAGINRSGPSGSREGITQFAPAIRLEGGYDLRLGPDLILSPFASFSRSFSADLKKEGRSLGVNATMSTMQVGLGVSWNWSQSLQPVP